MDELGCLRDQGVSHLGIIASRHPLVTDRRIISYTLTWNSSSSMVSVTALASCNVLLYISESSGTVVLESFTPYDRSWVMTISTR
jgi:hypothetical protein